MDFPPKLITAYALDNERNKRIFEKLKKLSERALTPEEQRLLSFLCSQLEQDWETPLEKFVDEWLNR